MSLCAACNSEAIDYDPKKLKDFIERINKSCSAPNPDDFDFVLMI
jgi:hypothetical protein